MRNLARLRGLPLRAAYLEFKRINPELALNMEGLTHLNDKTCPPLQVADMMASIAKEVYSEWPEGPLQVIPKRLEESIRRIWIPDYDYFEAILTVEKQRRGLP